MVLAVHHDAMVLHNFSRPGVSHSEEAIPEDFRYITLVQAAQIAGLSRHTLKIQLYRRRLKAVKIGRYWFTRPEWLEEYLSSRRITKSSVTRGSGAARGQVEGEDTSSTQDASDVAEIEEPVGADTEMAAGPNSVDDAHPEPVSQDSEVPTQRQAGGPAISEAVEHLDAVTLPVGKKYIYRVMDPQEDGSLRVREGEIYASVHDALRAIGVDEGEIANRKYWHRIDRLPKAYRQRILREEV